jgi:hypothetical protein
MHNGEQNKKCNEKFKNYTDLFHQKGNMFAKLLKVVRRTPGLSGTQF